MNTVVVKPGGQSIAQAARIIASGGLVAFPTETVYGLGADALNEAAVHGIFAAKGRPADNPLIVHISEPSQLEGIAEEIPAKAAQLMDAFWPGALTLVLPRGERVPDVVTAGLGTVAVRCPSHPTALALIRAAQTPIAAPSANRSGRPSPTRAQHVLQDMQGRIPMIIDGGDCELGLESTVLSVLGEQAVLLRPGGITKEMIEDVLGEPVALAKGVLAPMGANEAALSPGLKHMHYAPKAKVVLVEGPEPAKAMQRLLQRDPSAVALCMDGLLDGEPRRIGLGKDTGQMAQRLFAALRQADEEGYAQIYLQGVQDEGMGLAVMNRALRAAGFARIHTSDVD